MCVLRRCFFSIEWPQHSSLKIAREKLLYAINNCSAIDADNTREALRLGCPAHVVAK